MGGGQRIATIRVADAENSRYRVPDRVTRRTLRPEHSSGAAQVAPETCGTRNSPLPTAVRRRAAVRVALVAWVRLA